MKKILLTTVILSIVYSLTAQNKPQWLMPLYFTDGNGNRDTVYVGYDPAAGSRGEDIDTAFGEGWIIADTTTFNVYLWQYPHYGPTSILTSDSVRKTDISSFPYPYINIGFIKGKTPVTLKWDDSLLYSPSLPFPDISPRPRARIDFYCESGEPGYINCPIEYEPLTLTDYPATEIKYPVTDSLYFDGSGSDYYVPRKAIFNVLAQVVPHNFIDVGINKTDAVYGYEVFPNPFYDKITVQNLQNDKLNITLFDCTGKILTQVASSFAQVNLIPPALTESIYILKISTEKKVFIQKLIKNEVK